MSRNFEEWLSNFDDSIASWRYYTDFDKVYNNANKIKKELNLLNSLIGSKNIEQEFKELVEEYPKVLRAVPILIAKRNDVIIIKDATIYLIRTMTNLSQDEIGQLFDGRDHSTILYSTRQVESQIERDPRFAETIRQMKTNLESELASAQ